MALSSPAIDDSIPDGPSLSIEFDCTDARDDFAEAALPRPAFFAGAAA
jgi:hypothetical protein